MHNENSFFSDRITKRLCTYLYNLYKQTVKIFFFVIVIWWTLNNSSRRVLWNEYYLVVGTQDKEKYSSFPMKHGRYLYLQYTLRVSYLKKKKVIEKCNQYLILFVFRVNRNATSENYLLEEWKRFGMYCSWYTTDRSR